MPLSGIKTRDTPTNKTLSFGQHADVENFLGDPQKELDGVGRRMRIWELGEDIWEGSFQKDVLFGFGRHI